MAAAIKSVMSAERTFDDIWAKAKDILLPYEGAASQVYVLDLPDTELFRVASEFCRYAAAARVTTLAGFTTPFENAPAADDSQLEAIVQSKAYSIIAGAFAGQQSIQFWVWPKPDSGTWDAEFVFFTDQGSDEDVRAAFEQVHVLAEMARENSPASECVLSGSETGDPREEKGRSWTVWW